MQTTLHHEADGVCVCVTAALTSLLIRMISLVPWGNMNYVSVGISEHMFMLMDFNMF